MTPWTIACQAPLSMGILQARILESVAMFSSRGSSQPRDRTQVSHIAGRFFTIWATRETCYLEKGLSQLETRAQNTGVRVHRCRAFSGRENSQDWKERRERKGERYMCVCVCVCVCILSLFSCVRLFATLWTVARLTLGFFRQEYWSGLPCPPPGDVYIWWEREIHL